MNFRCEISHDVKSDLIRRDGLKDVCDKVFGKCTRCFSRITHNTKIKHMKRFKTISQYYAKKIRRPRHNATNG